MASFFCFKFFFLWSNFHTCHHHHFVVVYVAARVEKFNHGKKTHSYSWVKKKSNLELDVEHTYRLTHSLSRREKRARRKLFFSPRFFFSTGYKCVCVCALYLFFAFFQGFKKHTHTRRQRRRRRSLCLEIWSLSLSLTLATHLSVLSINYSQNGASDDRLFCQDSVCSFDSARFRRCEQNCPGHDQLLAAGDGDVIRVELKR